MRKIPNITEAKQFINYFNYEKVTIQLLKGGKAYKTVVFDSDAIDYDFLINEHQKYNAEVFMMINEGDGIVHDGKKTPRSSASVNRLTALFIDTDEAPINAVLAFLKGHKLKPHIAVESSPNKYHLYMLLKDSPSLRRVTNLERKFQQQVRAWKLCQEGLARMDNTQVQSDVTMKDASRILRIPGFYHLKNPQQPFLTRIRKVYSHKPYLMDGILKKLQNQSHQTIDNQDGDDQQEQSLDMDTGYRPPVGMVSEGSRHHEMTAFLGYLLNLGVTSDVALPMFYSFALNHFVDGKQFLPKGKRHFEVTDFIAFKLNDIKQANIVESNNTADLLLKAKTSDGLLDMPDDFYLNAPGLIGQITREISSRSMYPLPALAFASALSAVGTLKSSFYKTEFGHVPSNYFLCLAPTGSGKAYGQRVISHTFKELNMHNLIMSGIRSEKGIARFLEDNDSKGLIQLDESEDFFKTFSDQYAAHYLRACKDVLLQAYSAHDDPFKSMGRTGDKREKPIILKYPRLNMIAYGVNEMFKNVFTKSMVSDGLLQRFIIISTNNQRLKNQDFQPAESLSSNENIFKQIIEIVQKERDFNEKTFIAIQDLTAEIESTNDPKRQDELMKQLTKIQQASHKTEQKIITFSPQAQLLYEKFSNDRDKLVNKENAKRSGLAGLYTRDAEKVGRLLATACNTRITADDLDYYIQFITSRTDALHALCLEEFNRSSISKELEDLQYFIANNLNSDGVCTYRDIVRLYHVRDSNKLRSLLYDALDSNILTLHEKYRKGGGLGKAGRAYSLNQILG